MRKLLIVVLAFVAYALFAVSPQGPRQSVAVVGTTPAPLVIEERVAPEPRGRPVVLAVSTPAPTDAPAVAAAAAAPSEESAPVAAPVFVAAVSAPQSCPATFFCYPRLGIAGPVISYNDCSGATDVGTSIRQLTCIRGGIWLAGHAYTQFGRIGGFRVGDVVLVRGQRFEITGSVVHHACDVMTGAVAPLSLQTSLDNDRCGQVLVLQAR
jgi:hypothetical protein